MPNNNYARGAAFERKIKEYLESKGFYAVRAAGSHGLTDVLAIDKQGRAYFIQCKTGKAIMSKADRIELNRIASEYDGYPYSVEQDVNGQPVWYLILAGGTKLMEGF